MYYVVFHHGDDSTMDDIATFRAEEVSSGINRESCREERHFIQDSLNIVSRIECRGKLLGDPTITLSKSIETENGIYELYGQFSAAEYTFTPEVKKFLELEKGFGPK
jgi:hypothetical protein